MMQKQMKMLTAFACAMAWWSVFYPELCFTEDTCQLIQNAEAENPAVSIGAAQNAKTDTATEIMRAGEDEVVISSRFLEWCEENLFD